MFTPTHLRDSRRDRRILVGSLGALAIVAWLSLWLWEGSPYRAFLGHQGGVGPIPLEAALFSIGWVLMIVAMMLPSSIPLVLTFAALSQSVTREVIWSKRARFVAGIERLCARGLLIR